MRRRRQNFFAGGSFIIWLKYKENCDSFTDSGTETDAFCYWCFPRICGRLKLPLLRERHCIRRQAVGYHFRKEVRPVRITLQLWFLVITITVKCTHRRSGKRR